MAKSNPKRSRSSSPTSTKSKPSPRRPGPRVARPGDNTLEGKAAPYLKRIETKLSEIDSLRGTFMNRCKVIREDIREIIGESKDAGIPVKAMRGLISYRELEKKQAKIAADFDIDEAAAFDQLVETLGPLGIAAARAAGYKPQGNGAANDDERDVRPRHLTQPGASAEEPPPPAAEAPRADEEHLARVGRGHDPPPTEEPVNESRTDGEQPTTTH